MKAPNPSPRTAPNPWTRRARPVRALWGTTWLVAIGTLVAFSTGCGPKPFGPAFELAPLPPQHRARIYIYRADERSSLASVRVTLDGLDVGRFRDGEYETLELPSGTHRLRAGLRGFGLLAWGWNEHRVRMPPGQTVYLMLSVRLAEQGAPVSRELEIAGRDSGSASENVFIIPRTQSEALADLGRTTRLPDSADDSSK